MLDYKQNDTSKVIQILMVDSSDHVTPKTGLTLTVQISKNGAAFANVTGSVAELGSGGYTLTPSSADVGTLGPARIKATATGADQFDTEIRIVPWDPYDAVRMGLTAFPNAVAGGNGGLGTVDASNRVAGIQGTITDLDGLPTVNDITDGVGALNQTWFVSKTGNDANTGRRPDDAFLTFVAAKTAASAGDTITLLEGTWTETMVMKDGLTLQGVGKTKTIVSGVTKPITVYDDCTVRNLKTVASGSSGMGIYGHTKTNVRLENVDSYGDMDGIYMYLITEGLHLKNTTGSSKYDGINCTASTNFLFENCKFSTDCTQATGTDKRAILAHGGASGVLRDCIVAALATTESSDNILGIQTNGDLRIINTHIEATSSHASHTGNVIGLDILDGAEVVISQSPIITSSAGSGNVYDVDSAGDVTIDGNHHDSDKLHTSGSGTIRVSDDVIDLIHTKTQLLGSGVVTYSGPVITSETIEITQGDDYYSEDGRGIPWSSSSWADLTGATAVTFTAQRKGTSETITSTGSVTNPGEATQTVSFELSSTDTAALTHGSNNYEFQVMATLANTHETELLRGTMTVKERFTA